ncbi:MAG TPA: hypothetical protein PL017_09765 [Tenuifilaceae bacterium]|nr:hypothetical protein [Tenuifilaceae bacterium]HPE18729.1 hypothetical protein [Tenuifilaceae bacterium]HPJ46373.1 hypothetical protein [Tenuifilaceae bacterium]HPQ34880.1 hypothetical protein [Tenuifilaceae bacterium]HRX68464.1 hypothetical protein [Tenuifilaceae bacterium]
MKTLKTIFSVSLAAYMLLAMGGFSVFHHYCGCKKQIYTSVIIDDECCDHSSEHHSCCGDSDAGVCHSDSENDCDCETQVQVLKVDEFASNGNNVEVKNPVLFLFLTSFFQEIYSISTPSTGFSIPSCDAPPIWGRMLVISFHSIKIPEAIS